MRKSFSMYANGECICTFIDYLVKYVVHSSLLDSLDVLVHSRIEVNIVKQHFHLVQVMSIRFLHVS